MPKKIEPLNSGTPRAKTKKKDGRAKNGGARENSGPAPKEEKLIESGLKDLIDAHAQTDYEWQQNKKSGIVRKARALLLLDKLFELGLKRGNIQAIKEYFDRTLGKAPQPLTGDTKNPLAIRVISVDPAIAEKYDLNTSPKDNSGGPPPVPGR